ncbi:MAG: PD-(D/E)XK nuclease family protein [Nitrospinota bacterium]
MPIYSHSRLNTYETCPLKYKLQYIDRVEIVKREGIELFLGSRVHEAMEKLYKDLRYSKLLTVDELISYYNDEWDKNWNDAVIIRNKDISAQNCKDTGVRCLKNYYKRYAPFNQATVIWIEEERPFSLSEDGKYKIRGVIDRLDKIKDEVYDIHDYKTGRLSSQEELDKDWQLALYEMIVRKEFLNVTNVRLVWHFLAFDTEMLSTRTPEHLSDLRKETIALIDRIEADKEFKHKESNLCDWCDYWVYCPAKKHLVKVDALPPKEYLADDGVTLVNKYTAVWNKLKEIEREKEEIRADLIAYAKKEDVETIKGSDHTVKVTFKERLKFPNADDPKRMALEKVIKDAGLWNEVSRLDTNALEKAVDLGKLDEGVLEKVKKFSSPEESVIVSQPKVVRKDE